MRPHRIAKAPSGLAAALLLGIGCQAPEPPAASPAEASGQRPVAEVDGKPIRADELRDWMKDDLYQKAISSRSDAALYAFTSDALDQMILERLLVAEGERRGLGAADLYEQETRSASHVDDSEVQAFYDEHKGELGGAGFEAAQGPIRDQLERRKAAAAWREFLGRLRGRAQVELRLEPPRVAVQPVGPVRGRDDAPVTIVEFIDYECPYCRRAEPMVQQILERYPESVRIVTRHFPLDPIHPHARPAAEAAACAGEQKRFLPYHERLIASPPPLERKAFERIARETDLDLPRFQKCLEHHAMAVEVDADVEAGHQAGVDGTPAFFVNGIPLSGAVPAEDLARIIDRELARASGASS